MGSIGDYTTAKVQSRESYEIIDEPSRSRRKIRIIVIGAGASALNFAHDIDQSTLDIELVLYEKNPEIGGTWFENRYPGCGCDIPSVNYQFSWAPSPDWTSFYSGAPEILKYFKRVADEHGLHKYIRLSHRVVGASWNEHDEQWRVKVQRGDNPDDVFEDRGHILVNASGVLNKWKWPAIQGRETFQGPMLHSAHWDDQVELKGKRVAVIGSGSSAVQIVPTIQPNTAKQKKILQNDPQKYLAYRKKIESELNSRFRFILNGSEEQANARAYAEKDMRTKLASRPDIADHIVPKDFAVGCRRPTPGNGYLEALCSDNTEVVSQSIAEITPRGIKTTDGVEHEVDVIVCATGFDVSWRPSYPTIGRESRSLSEQWKDIPRTYLSITVPNFPNYLIFNGPFGPYGHGSFLPITETLSRHFLQILEKMSSEGVTSFEPKAEAVAEFFEHHRKFMPRTAWTSPCRSWFKQGTVDGEVMMWPGSRIHFFETMKQPRWEDYHLRYTTNNRFGYLGNGFAAREFDGSDLSWYLGTLEGNEQAYLPDEEFTDFMVY
ncbi:dimethylaniline monooxygenase [Aspergillus japonicus CBS 114.51]|uniref:Dimethylaniline monooxygenase n=1 Tax=Aspergillus japonicus CBS 114.51 TaxID=1448312 RepID=A0A8T8WVD3_ASPJA|nr:dimethylaniline monooxygenase [Aspergillus japonicus CBS 114.51]RAH79614.1 dimethylaniline monooxygenase [Aspergillus japonicus CBS 114.51]